MTSLDPCPSCGAKLGGRAGCQAAFDALGAQAFSSPGRARTHNMVVDAYAMQHPEEYGVSAKSYIRHLFALGCLLEYPGDEKLYWVRTRKPAPPAPPKPPLLPAGTRGTLTIADVVNGASDEEHRAQVERWARSVWSAYAPQHAIAHAYLAAVRAAMG